MERRGLRFADCPRNQFFSGADFIGGVTLFKRSVTVTGKG